ncbi:heme-binding protein [Labrys neptuniae]
MLRPLRATSHDRALNCGLSRRRRRMPNYCPSRSSLFGPLPSPQAGKASLQELYVNIRLEQAQAIVAGVLEYAVRMRMKPICAIVLDARGELRAAATLAEASLKRSSITRGKADGALAMGMGSSAER